MTDAEMEDVNSGTDQVFGPFFLGAPFDIVYCAVWCGISFACRAIIGKFRRPSTPVEDTTNVESASGE